MRVRGRTQLGTTHLEVSCSFLVSVHKKNKNINTLYFIYADRLQIKSNFAMSNLKCMLMGLLDFLLFGAFMNSLRNNQNNNNNSDYSNRSYNQGYEDGYDDGYMDYDDYHYHDVYASSG